MEKVKREGCLVTASSEFHGSAATDRERERERESLLSKSGFSWAARRGQSSFNFQIDPDLNQKKKARRRKTLVSASVFVSMTSWLDGKKGLGRRRLSAASVAKIVSGERTTRSTRRPWKIRFRGNWSFDRNFWIRFKRNVLTFLPFSFFSPSLSLSFSFWNRNSERRRCCSKLI